MKIVLFFASFNDPKRWSDAGDLEQQPWVAFSVSILNNTSLTQSQSLCFLSALSLSPFLGAQSVAERSRD
ncbi:uncharacterized protein G2W53_024093 [Senna tora]|uniref:Uncharacterized protein n=1 Tax=Senna tora TaxID=362788 RepID=A0A834TAM7_9FABA|nr:uncharacterized protein G2W53_024093 [Senna tora]